MFAGKDNPLGVADQTVPPLSERRALLDQLAFSGELWLHPGQGGWTFVTLPADCADQIRFYTGTAKGRAWGMVKVTARIGSSVWDTAIWPDRASGSFLLPVKAAVRKKEKVAAGDRAEIALTLLTPPGF